MSVGLVAVATGILFTNCSKSGFDAAAPEDSSGSDPLLAYAWHINNTGQKVFASSGGGIAGFDLNILETWTSSLGGAGIKVLISDDGVEDSHEDLKANYSYTGISKNYYTSSPYYANTAAPKYSDDNHGTAVAGLVAAVAGNGVGTKGVAHKVSLVSANFLSSGVSQTLSVIANQASGDYDIFNMSWGNSQNYLPDPVSAFETALLNGVVSGRGGKGSIFVKAAGNDFLVYCKGSSSDICVGNSNFDPDNNTPYTILTAALNAQGYAASYSSVGANIWISSFGGEYGDDYPAMLTTDRTGCSAGYSQTSVAGKVEFERGKQGNSDCNYTTTFNGTSAAAPVLSGVVALILEANPELSWRDVKYILAKTAVPVNASAGAVTSHPLQDYPGNNDSKNVTLPSGAVWENGWVTNGAGFKFHNWYGFGRVDVDAAIALAKSYTSLFTSQITSSGWYEASPAASIPDNSASPATSTVSVTETTRIEAIRIKLNIDHDNVGDLGVELISPAGTKSMILNMRNALLLQQDYAGEIFLSNAFFQESSQGTWTLKVTDGGSGHSGTLTSWGLQVIGSP